MSNNIANTDIVYAEAARALTNSILVAQKFGKEHKNVMQAIQNLIGVSAENSADTNNQQLSEMFTLAEYDVELNNGTGATRKAPMYVMNRDGFSLLVMGFTGKQALKFKLDYIKAFNAMERKLKANVASLPHTDTNPQLQYVQTQLYLADALADRLRMNEVSRLGMYQSIAEPYRIPIPQYVASKGVKKSAKELLAEMGSGLSVIRFNQMLVKHGFLETLTRLSSGGKIKKFKNVTEKGKAYGENDVNFKNPNETQPHWYADRFTELYNILTA